MQTPIRHEAIESPEKFFANYYHVYYRLAQEYINEIPFYPNESVLDIGCRNGKVTAMLSYLNPDVHFTAITTTDAFLDQIQNDNAIEKMTNMQFETQLLSDYQVNKHYDKVVSFLCLNWQHDKESILKKIYHALKPGKKAHLQLFVDHGQNWFDQCIFDVAKLPQWESYFKNFTKKCQPVKPGVVLALSEQIGFIIEKCILQKRKIPLQDEKYFKNWIMTWSSHLAYLPHDKIDVFFAQAVENYLKGHPKDESGRIYYEDYFFEMTLLKPEGDNALTRFALLRQISVDTN